MAIGLLTDDSADTAGEFIGSILVGFFFWGSIVFIGTCYLVVPLIGLVVASGRYLLEIRCSRN